MRSEVFCLKFGEVKPCPTRKEIAEARRKERRSQKARKAKMLEFFANQVRAAIEKQMNQNGEDNLHHSTG